MNIRRFGLISDTHGTVHPDVHQHFAGVEAIYHGGDVGGRDILAELETIAPVFPVVGNTDAGMPELPDERVEAAPFGNVAVAHGHLFPVGRDATHQALAQHFAAASPRLILYGHSHRPALDQMRNTWIVNPGSAGPRRFQSPVMLVVLRWDVERDSLSFQFEQLHGS